MDPNEVVQLVATHWHDDHIRGFADLVGNCSGAKVTISTALEADEFLTLVAADAEMLVSANSGIREMRRTLEVLKGTGRHPNFAMADRRLYLRSACSGGPNAEVWALSPSSASIREALQRFGTLHPVAGTPKRAIPRPKRNPACVVLLVKVGLTEILLGADLERSNDSDQGWGAIVSSQGVASTAVDASVGGLARSTAASRAIAARFWNRSWRRKLSRPFILRRSCGNRMKNRGSASTNISSPTCALR